MRRGVDVGMGADREPGVVRHVEPLVPVARPRVGQLDAVDEVAGCRAGGRPQPERAVDVDPGAVGAGDGARVA